MADAAAKTNQQREDEWWAAWRKSDYSWDGLANRLWEGWSVVADGKEIIATEKLEGRQARRATLQDYWREEEAHLIDGEGKRWTRVHCPLTWADGTASPKKSWSAAERGALDALVSAKVSEAAETTFEGPWDNRELLGADRRTQLQGAVLFGMPSHSERVRSSLSARFEHAYFVEQADFNRAVFSGDTFFENATFSRGARFDRATFSGGVRFDGATFAAFPDVARFGFDAFLEVLRNTQVSDLFRRVHQVMDKLRVPDSERKEVEQNLAEAIAADLLVRLGRRLSEDDKAELARIGEKMVAGQEPDLNTIAAFFRTKFSQEELVRALAEAAESVLLEFTEAMNQPDGARKSDGVGLDSATAYSEGLSAGARFNNTAFCAAAAFGGVTFCTTAHFLQAKFHGHTDFGRSKFMKEANFYRVLFEDNAWFEYSSFRGETAFERAKFSDVASFCHAEFLATANFEVARFADRARFWKTRFLQSAEKGEMKFVGAQFAKTADFSGAVFPHRCEQFSAAFHGARFDGVADFGKAGTHWIAAFHGALLKENLILDDPSEGAADAEFKGTVLRGTRKTAAADVAERAEAEERERADQAEKEGGSPKKITLADKRAWAREAPQDRLRQLIGGCRVVQDTMARQSDELMAQRYYRFQLMARRRQRGMSWDKLLLFLYGSFSDYGASMARPLAMLALSFALFAGAFWGAGVGLDGLYARAPQRYDIGALPLNDIWEAAIFSLNNIFRPLSALSSEAASPSDETWAGQLLYSYPPGFGFGLRLLAVLQSLLAITLVFLFALTVRRRFQMS